MEFNIYSAGTNETRELLGRAPDFQAARDLYDSNPLAWQIVPVGEAAELEPLGNLAAINPRYGNGLYIIRESDGVSCLGFEYAARRASQVAAWVKVEGVAFNCREGAPGTPEAFAYYRAAMKAGADHNRATGRRCNADLVAQLCGLEGKRVEVVDSYGDKRRFIVGKSTGWLPCHLEIETPRASGGGTVTGAPFASVRTV